MNATELVKWMNTHYGTQKWPKTLEVNAETYGYACQAVFNHRIKEILSNELRIHTAWVEIGLGPSNGLMFKNVELILKVAKD